MPLASAPRLICLEDANTEGVVGGLLGARIGVVQTFWAATVGMAVATLPVLFSPLARLRELPETAATGC